MTMLRASLWLTALSLLLSPSLAYSHGGGLDDHGCHNDRKRGGYHCHRGPLAGQSFTSLAEMLTALNDSTATQRSTPLAALPAAQEMKSYSARVIVVHDGDTISTMRPDGTETRIRLYGIDCPEASQPYGAEAKDFVEDLLLTDLVTVEPVEKDRYGRTVAVVRLKDGSTMEDMLLGAGLAWVYPKYCNRSECVRWKAVEREAREEKMGLWEDGKAVAPWEWRKGKKL
jgi:endonuclease YncB( thermonuclease family)